MENKKDVKKTINKKAVIIAAGGCVAIGVAVLLRTKVFKPDDIHVVCIETVDENVYRHISKWADALDKSDGFIGSNTFTCSEDLRKGLTELVECYEKFGRDTVDILVNIHD